MINEAYLNAAKHIKQLTGNYYLPHQIIADNWAKKHGQEFYNSIGKYFPSPVGSKNRGYIENFFGSNHWKNMLKWGADNYTGNNITAKHAGVNREMVGKLKKERLVIGEESERQIESFFHRLRTYPVGATGVSKQQAWLEAWAKLDDSKKRLINHEQYLLKFGAVHVGKPSLTNRGIEIQKDNVKYSFDIVGGTPLAHIGKKVEVYFDPKDISQIVVTNHEEVRLMAVAAQYHAKAMVDYTDGSRTLLNTVFEAKKLAVAQAVNAKEKRKQILQLEHHNAEIALLDGYSLKELKQASENYMIAEAVDGNDFNPYSLL